VEPLDEEDDEEDEDDEFVDLVLVLLLPELPLLSEPLKIERNTLPASFEVFVRTGVL
jgi:hypothetical protein